MNHKEIYIIQKSAIVVYFLLLDSILRISLCEIGNANPIWELWDAIAVTIPKTVQSLVTTGPQLFQGFVLISSW